MAELQAAAMDTLARHDDATLSEERLELAHAQAERVPDGLAGSPARKGSMAFSRPFLRMPGRTRGGGVGTGSLPICRASRWSWRPRALVHGPSYWLSAPKSAG